MKIYNIEETHQIKSKKNRKRKFVFQMPIPFQCSHFVYNLSLSCSWFPITRARQTNTNKHSSICETTIKHKQNVYCLTFSFSDYYYPMHTQTHEIISFSHRNSYTTHSECHGMLTSKYIWIIKLTENVVKKKYIYMSLTSTTRKFITHFYVLLLIFFLVGWKLLFNECMLVEQLPNPTTHLTNHSFSSGWSDPSTCIIMNIIHIK